jgi:hypothetical protein
MVPRAFVPSGLTPAGGVGIAEVESPEVTDVIFDEGHYTLERSHPEVVDDDHSADIKQTICQ